MVFGPIMQGMPRRVSSLDRRRDPCVGGLPFSPFDKPFSISVPGKALKEQLQKRIAEDRAWAIREEDRLRAEFDRASREGLVDLPDAVAATSETRRTVLDEESESIAFHEFLVTVLADDESYVLTYNELRQLLAPPRAPWRLGGGVCM